MPWQQRPSGGWNWKCPLCRHETVEGQRADRPCCFISYVEDTAHVEIERSLADARAKGLAPIEPLESTRGKLEQVWKDAHLRMASLTHNFYIVDVNPERHRPYHEKLAQDMTQGTTDGQTHLASILSGQRTSHEGSGSSPATADGTRGSQDGREDHDDTQEGQAGSPQTVEEGRTITGRIPSTIPLQNLTPGTDAGRDILNRFLRTPDEDSTSWDKAIEILRDAHDD